MSDSVRPHRQQPTSFCHPWDSPGKNTGVGCHFLPQCVKVKSLSCVWHFGPHGLQPTRLLRPWDFPDKSTGVGCHCLLPLTILGISYTWNLYNSWTATSRIVISEIPSNGIQNLNRRTVSNSSGTKLLQTSLRHKTHCSTFTPLSEPWIDSFGNKLKGEKNLVPQLHCSFTCANNLNSTFLPMVS